MPLGEGHLRRVIREFVEHYHVERNHQGFGNVIPFPANDAKVRSGRIRRRERLGGLLRFYERDAALFDPDPIPGPYGVVGDGLTLPR